jgi:hypothetical protein
MVVAQTITVGGLENKDIAWRCEYDGVMAELRHPVQYVHLNVGDIDDVDGRRRRLVYKEIRGAELVVYHEWVREGAAAPTGVDRLPGERPSPRAESASRPATPKRARTAKSATRTARTVAAKPGGAAGRAPTAKRPAPTRPPARSKRPRRSGGRRKR